jgi:hypothetical protein
MMNAEFIYEHRVLIAVAEACWRPIEPDYGWHVLEWLCWKQRCKYPLTLHMFTGIITS